MENFWKIEAIFPKTTLKTALKIAIWVFLGFSKQFPTSISVTSTLRVPPSPGFCSRSENN